MSSVWKSIGPEKASHHPLYGIKGWLLVFVVGNFIGPLLTLGWVNAEAMRYHMSIGQLLNIERPEIAFMQAALYLEIALAVATIFLIFTRNQYFRPITIAGRLASWPTLAAIALSQGISETGNSLAQSFFPWAVSCAVWVTYLQRSKRVRVTFEHCVRDDEREIESETVSNLSSYTNRTNATMPSSARPLTLQTNQMAMPPQGRAAIRTFTGSRMQFASTSIAFDENEAYQLIAEEIETGRGDKGLWLKAMIQTIGQDEKMQKVVYSQLRLGQLKAESAERTFAEAASNLAKEVPEFDELEAESYVPVGKQNFLGLIVRELANGLAAVETNRQQRCYKDVSAAKSAIQEFRQDGRWTLRGLTVAIERSSSK